MRLLCDGEMGQEWCGAQCPCRIIRYYGGLMSDIWANIKFFTPTEFDSPDAPGSGFRMNISFIEILDQIRKDCGFAFQIHSGFRTPEHNSQVAVVENSAHTFGLAADIGVTDGAQRWAIVKSAFDHGITRVGIGETFVHLDLDLSKPQHVIWTYPTH